MSSIITEEQKISALISRRVEQLFPNQDEVVSRLRSGERLRFYLGIDPTSPYIHLGHTIPLLLLKSLADLGHEIILLIGDFTARIGDPTDKGTARSALTEEQVKDNMASYVEQISKIMPKGSYTLKYNSSWLQSMSFEDVIKLSAHFTVQQMLVRDMFQKRIEEQKPIFLNEFFYPLMQGYDSVAMEVDGEVGGTDQTFNMLVGRDLEKILLGKDKIVLTARLLENPETGKKMSKSEGNSIGVAEEPNEMFGKVMAYIPDAMIRPMFELCTEVPLEQINELETEFENPKHFKEALAKELVTMYHSAEAAQKAQEEFNNVFSKNQLPKDIQEYELKDKETVVDALINSGLYQSRSEVKRLVEQKAIAINDAVIESWDAPLSAGDIIKAGSRHFLKLR